MKEKKTLDELLEILVVVLLGVTALLTAWASWIGSLHGGNQATNYTRSNNLAAEGNAEYNAAIQSLTQDMMLYNEVNNMLIDQIYAEESGDTAQAEALDWKIDEHIMGNFSEELTEAMIWASDQTETSEETVSPFEMEGFVESYFDSATELLAESEAVLEEGSADNTNADSYGLVTVIYSVVAGYCGNLQGSEEPYRAELYIRGGVPYSYNLYVHHSHAHWVQFQQLLRRLIKYMSPYF